MEEIDLKELFNMFWSRKIYIALITAIFLVIGIVYSYVFVDPDYDSTTTIILAQANKSSTETTTTQVTETDTITASDLTLNQKLVSTYSELLKSKNILAEVITHLRLNMSEDSLKKSITVSTVKDTDLIKIRVTDKSPQQAKDIADEIADVFIDKVANGVYNINNAKVWDKAEVSNSPYNINHIKDMAIFVVIGLVVAAGYVLIANMLDTTVKSKEDVENKIGVSVLTTIPICNFEHSMSKQMQQSGKKGGRK